MRFIFLAPLLLVCLFHAANSIPVNDEVEEKVEDDLWKLSAEDVAEEVEVKEEEEAVDVVAEVVEEEVSDETEAEVAEEEVSEETDAEVAEDEPKVQVQEEEAAEEEVSDETEAEVVEEEVSEEEASDETEAEVAEEEVSEEEMTDEEPAPEAEEEATAGDEEDDEDTFEEELKVATGEIAEEDVPKVWVQEETEEEEEEEVAEEERDDVEEDALGDDPVALMGEEEATAGDEEDDEDTFEEELKVATGEIAEEDVPKVQVQEEAEEEEEEVAEEERDDVEEEALEAEGGADNSTDADGCTAAWSKINQVKEKRGCVGKKLIKRYTSKCGNAEVEEKITNLLAGCRKNKDEPKMFMAVKTEDAATREWETAEANETLLSRGKRFVLSGENRLWPQAKIPFLDGYSQGNQRAIKTWERYTCIRFVPYEKNDDGTTTNDELGLGHPSYVTFIYDGGCWADMGNRRSESGQKISCCGGVVCVHELGHVLGAYHEHQNPLGKGTIRLNPQNADSKKMYNFKETRTDGTYSSGFDMKSVMAYGRTTFSNGNGEVITYEFSDLGGGSDYYYLFQEVSHTHKCQEMYCSDVDMECVNDGYMTLTEGVCGCVCPDGLDPTTGCATALKDTEGETTPATSKWPAGNYALPMTEEGCPSDVFSEGTRIQTGAEPGACEDKTSRGCAYWKRAYGCDENPGFMHKTCPDTCEKCDTFGNHESEPHHLAGETTTTQAEHKFCTKDSTDGDDDRVQWPVGQYCIYKTGGSCPDGMDEGSTTFSDEEHDGATNSESGSLPDGDFSGSTTTFEFCCSKYGFTSDELVFPRTQPFALLGSADESSCHNVKGMHVYKGFTVIKNGGGSAPSSTGDSPVREMDSGKNTYYIPYCYYTPTEKECGGEIELTEDNPTATITGSAGPEQMCTWLIKGGENTRINLNIDEMDIAAEDDDDCIDSLSVRYDRLGQRPWTFCGKKFQKTISTVHNMMTIQYNTYLTGESSFTATVSLLSQSNMCYSLADQGQTYAGKVSRTRGMKECIPWAKAAHCPHHPFQDSDMMDGLQDNYCRNPDLVDGLRPWCYTDAEGCQREYCDVCQFESLFDVSGWQNCEVLAKNGLCDNDPDVQTKCAAACSEVIKTFPQDPLASEVSCSAPGDVTDGTMISEEKSSYAYGDVVTYKCNDDSIKSNKERKCLSTGEWSSLNYVCSECELGWEYFEGNCYYLDKDWVEYSVAVDNCKSMGASLVMAKSEDELNFLHGIDFWTGTWLAASDADSEGDWVWSDGTAFDYTKWMSGQPDNYGNEDCVWLTASGWFEDRWCTRDTQSYICIKPENTITTCDDVTDDCANFYFNNPASCETNGIFMKRNCKKTCGQCDDVASCDVEDATENAQLTSDVSSISQGESVSYECKSGYDRVSGDAVRGCQADGSMTGQALECQSNAEVSTTDEDVMQSGSGSKTGHGYVWTGDIPGLVIPQNGKIIKWQFWSHKPGHVAFQVWRDVGDEDNLEFVGQNEVDTPNYIGSTYYVPEADQIAVQKGDYIGIYYLDTSGAVEYESCDDDRSPNLKRNWYKDTDNDFEIGTTTLFYTDTKQNCRIYRFKAILGDCGDDCVTDDTECAAGLFGEDCLQECHCSDSTEACDVMTGVCQSGCAENWSGDNCQTFSGECPDGSFGVNCKFACNCKEDEVCDKTEGTCVSGCKDGFWGPHCQNENDCYYSGSTSYYQGTVSTTKSGYTCQRWDQQTPHSHSYNKPDIFADGVLPENYCRNSLYENYKLWCMTADTGKSWEYCSIKSCDCPSGLFGLYCESQCHCADSGEKCNAKTGSCKSGCAAGWSGDDCNTPDETLFAGAAGGW